MGGRSHEGRCSLGGAMDDAEAQEVSIVLPGEAHEARGDSSLPDGFEG